MDTFVDSAPGTSCATATRRTTRPWWPRARDYWMPMDQYIGGIEHAILHLLYARFWTKVMRDLGLVKIDEPFTKLLTQGMVLNHIYYQRDEKGGKDYYPPPRSTPCSTRKAASRGGTTADGTPVEYGGVGKMAKSKNNGVDPQDLIEKYGADTARLYTMFTAPPEATLEWNDAAVEGSYRFLRRVWDFGVDAAGDARRSRATARRRRAAFGKDAKALRREVHTVLRQIDYDYQRMQYNTVVSGAMKLLNALEGFKADGRAPATGAALREGFGILLRALYPATPHIAHALWQRAGLRQAARRAARRALAAVDAAALEQDEIELMLQVNGKLRGAVRCRPAPSRQQIEQLALASEAFAKHADGRRAKQVIVVPGPPGQHGGLMRPTPHASLPRRAAAGRRAAWRWPAAASSCARRRTSPSRSHRRARAARRSCNELRRNLPRAARVQVVPTGSDARRPTRCSTCWPNQREKRRGRERRGPGARTAAAPARALPAAHAGRARSCFAEPRSLQQRDISFNETAGAGQGSRRGAAVPRHADRHRAADPCAAWRPSSRLTDAARAPAQLDGHLQQAACSRSTRSTATSRCWRRRRPTPSAPRRARRATPSAACTPWPARTSTGARCWRPAARSACLPTSRSSRSASPRASRARTAAPRCSSSPKRARATTAR